MKTLHGIPLILAVSALAGCAAMAPAPAIDQAALPEAVRAPDGNNAVMMLVGKGEITYECRAKADAPGQFAWAFVAPNAVLLTASGLPAGRYYGGPTWEALDGSKVTGKQVAVAPAQPGSIPLQLVKAETTPGNATFNNITYIQRLNTDKGVAPALPCDASLAGQKQIVTYQADYVFYRAR